MLCHACRRVLTQVQKQPILTTPARHHASLADVQKAIDDGCAICKRLNFWQLNEGDGCDDRNEWYTCVATEWHDRDPLLPPNAIDMCFSSKKATMDDEDAMFGPVSGNLRLIPVDPATDRLLVPAYLPTGTVGAEDAMGLVHQWIKTCDDHHQACKRPQVESDPLWRPTRLIQIDDGDARLRLVRGETLPCDFKYATLSHCWGRIADKMVLTKSNLDEWSQKLPPLARWKTFADAIKIARCLGLSYIWIDSLCIIQDSIGDWQNECPHMCDVYKRSYCNIAATSAENDTMGCFWGRDISVHLPLRVYFENVKTKSDKPITIATDDLEEASLLGPYDICNDQTWFEDVKGSVLNGLS